MPKQQRRLTEFQTWVGSCSLAELYSYAEREGHSKRTLMRCRRRIANGNYAKKSRESKRQRYATMEARERVLKESLAATNSTNQELQARVTALQAKADELEASLTAEKALGLVLHNRAEALETAVLQLTCESGQQQEKIAALGRRLEVEKEFNAWLRPVIN